MTKQNPEPPPLPGKTLAKVTSFSRGNSLSVVLVAGLSLLYAAVKAQWDLAGWAALATAAGALEWIGQRNLRAGQRPGLSAMIGAQFLLLGVIWAYAWLRWRNFDPDAYWNQFPAFVQELLVRRMLESGLDPVYDRPLLMMLTNLLTCALLAVIALAYQGGLAVWYAAKARALRSDSRSQS